MILFDKKLFPKDAKIICDHTLEDLTHWLRAAGYDVVMPIMNLNGMDMLEMATNDNRVLIINENMLNGVPRHSTRVIPIRSTMVYEQIKEVSKMIELDWTFKPFSRCMVCNSELTPLNISHWMDLPKVTKKRCVTSHGCKSCNRIYWAGEQIDRMVEQLEKFNCKHWALQK